MLKLVPAGSSEFLTSKPSFTGRLSNQELPSPQSKTNKVFCKDGIPGKSDNFPTWQVQAVICSALNIESRSSKAIVIKTCTVPNLLRCCVKLLDSTSQSVQCTYCKPSYQVIIYIQCMNNYEYIYIYNIHLYLLSNPSSCINQTNTFPTVLFLMGIFV